MGVRHHGGRPTRRRWLAIVTLTALLAGGALAGALAVAPAAASASASSHFGYPCGASFTPGRFHCLAIENMAAHPTAKTVRPGAIPAGNGYGPSDLQSAYGLTSASAADGAGATVAVVDAYDDPTAAADLAAYRSAADLPALTSGQFTVYNQEGQTSPLPSPSPTGDDWTPEESLDVDMVSAICPLCKIDLVEADNDLVASGDLFIADLTAATTLGAKYITDSWGVPEASAETALDSTVFSVPGVVYVAGSGDAGYAGGMVYPAASPDVVSVGGTTLDTASNSRGWTESAWYTPATSTTPVVGTGSGCSAYEPQPSWQASLSIITSACSKRVDNDVAADADPNTGAAIYDTSSQMPNQGTPGWYEFGGTSESTAIITAVFALAGNSSNGGSNGGNNAAESIYTNSADLNEVTASSNGTCTESVLCTATGAASTYNGPTGWGTPNGITAFASVANTVLLTNPGSQAGTIGTPVSLQISGTDSDSSQTLTYTATNLPAGLSISSAGLISGTPTTAATSQVTVTATDTTNASRSASFSWTISPASSSSSSSSSPAAAATSVSPSSTCSSAAATSTSASATSTTSPSPTPSATPSPTASATPSPTSTSSTEAANLTSLVLAASDCSTSATSTPSASASSAAAAPTPSAVSSSLAVTG
jgi:subtilase family serine protease